MPKEQQKEELPYKIQSISEQYDIGGDGRLRLVKIITYRSVTSDVGTIRIPADEFTADAAKELILKEVYETMKLRGLID